ncbi:hypothetical protein FHY31_002516 [Xanthomonas euvesicatoria]|uniref:Uncharacterized protein n=1 Tax=Xanthomonas euvesicatoria TaxID=456327 RepID=A0AAW3U4I4_XANEU|nr:hypothetical protein [Xanthomonas euvesicatoria]MBB4870754.1 hypothetical protein [Xanthomonas euvesicatoria]BBJ96329.1 hypothetical protein Xcc1_20590 [Xanthomonas campestris pv. campestris]BBJ98676.1 hypothetical protein Xcc1_44060 [Xanthomonas campestris pv. campestris]CCF70662.1 cointegrate resolution T domain protein [Xanthomonas citri pv. punicae str. LMG 859]
MQVALRQANEALTAKNHDLMQLNRDNGQWPERQTRLERELAQAWPSFERERRFPLPSFPRRKLAEGR